MEADNGTSTTEESRTSKPSVMKIAASAFPRRTLEETIIIAKALYENFATTPVPWETITEVLGRGAKSPQTKLLIRSAESYGIILKVDTNNFILTEIGRKIVAPTYEGEKVEAARQAILSPSILSKFYSDYNLRPVPKDEYFPNILEQTYGIPRDRFNEAREVILDNAKFAKILQEDPTKTYQVINIALPISETKADSSVINGHEVTSTLGVTVQPSDGDNTFEQLEDNEITNTCFVISPIGQDGTEIRKHADLILNHLIVPVLKSFNIKVIRADKIDKGGLITQQILEYLVRSKICICDLSYNNPNVFYELGVRHMTQLPCVQIIRKGDKIPFDVAQGRTIMIDLEDKFTLIDRIESARRELTDHLKAVFSKDGKEIADENPIKVYLPTLKVSLPK